MVITSCSSVRVASDYERTTNFDEFKTFAFFKTGIDKAEINDLDKVNKTLSFTLAEARKYKIKEPHKLYSYIWNIYAYSVYPYVGIPTWVYL